jgi:hypothetical protein
VELTIAATTTLTVGSGQKLTVAGNLFAAGASAKIVVGSGEVKATAAGDGEIRFPNGEYNDSSADTLTMNFTDQVPDLLIGNFEFKNVTITDGTRELEVTGAVTLPNGTSFGDDSGNNDFFIELGGPIVVGSGASLVLGDDAELVATSITMGTSTFVASTGSVVFIGATTFNGTTKAITLANEAVLQIDDGAALAISGNGAKIALLHTELGVGTYTAAGTVEITAGTSTDTIETETAADNGLTVSGTTGLVIGDDPTTAGVTLKGVTLRGTGTVAAAGTLTLSNAGVLTLASAGTIATTGTGAVVAGGVTIGGTTDGTWAATGGTSIAITATNATTATITATDSSVLTASGTDPSIVVAASGTLVVSANTKVLAGFLELGTGTWLATNAAATITEDTLTLANASGAMFGKDDGTSATVLTGTTAPTNSFTASGAIVTLAQDGNKLTITGAGAGATLTTAATAGITAAGDLDITTAIVDISVANTSIIKLEDSSTGIILAANGVIRLAADAGATATSNKKAIAGLTIDTGVAVWAASDSGNALIHKFVGSAANNTIVEGGSGFEIKNDIKTDG